MEGSSTTPDAESRFLEPAIQRAAPTAAISSETKLFVLIPGRINDAIPSPMKVASQIINMETITIPCYYIEMPPA